MHNSRRKKMLICARFLIFISIALFVYGLFIDFNNRYELFGTPNVGTVKDKNDNTISVTPANGNEVVSDNDKPSSDLNGNNSPTTSKNDSSVTQQRNKDDLGVYDEKQDAINVAIKNSIERTYNVRILYGADTEGYVVNDLTTVPIKNSMTIYEKLMELEEILNKYPEGMFKEIEDGGIPLTIILINNYSNTDVTGVTDSSYNYAKISLATIYSLEDSFYHESYHYIERYLFKKGANYNSWDTLLPGDFLWGTIDGSLSYSTTFSEDAFFVNNYAQTSASEDRASTFEYMMADTKASCLNKNKIIWIKAVYMSRTIESVLNSVRPDTIEYWERFNEENNN